MNEEIEEIYHNTVQEMKRIDHIIFVTLKYTRTIDVLKSIVERMIMAFDFMLDYILEYYKDKGEIDSYQKSPGLKCDLIRKLTNDEKIAEILDFYLLLRRVSRAEYDVVNEYKRHVGMVIRSPDGTEVGINIDSVTEYFRTMKEYLSYVRRFVTGEKEDD